MTLYVKIVLTCMLTATVLLVINTLLDRYIDSWPDFERGSVQEKLSDLVYEIADDVSYYGGRLALVTSIVMTLVYGFCIVWGVQL